MATAEHNKNVWMCEALYSAPVAEERAVQYKPQSQQVVLNVLRAPLAALVCNCPILAHVHLHLHVHSQTSR